MIEILACLIVGISDGDTLAARCGDSGHYQQIKVRLAEIDAPEKAQPFGQASKASLSQLCFQRPAEVRVEKIDRYGRSVARVACDGRDASAHQASAGLAWAYTQYLTDSTIKQREQAAQQRRAGLWQDAMPTPPWEWRKARRERS